MTTEGMWHRPTRASTGLVAYKSAEATTEADQIPWHRTLDSKPTKGAIAMDQKGLVHAVAVRTRLSREELADITRAVLEGLVGQLSQGAARRLAANLPDLGDQLPARRTRTNAARPVTF